MLPRWCWPQLLGQPLILMCSFAASGSATAISVTRSWMARFSPIELVMPSLQLSVPGQLTTSRTVSAPASARSSAASRAYTSYRLSSRTQRSTMFCCTVVRAFPPQ